MRPDMNYASLVSCESQLYPGVGYRVRRMSFARRLDLLSRLRGLAARLEFERAGETAASRVESALLEAEMNRAWIEWGLESLAGLQLDGEPATPESLLASGPEDLCREIAERVRGECFLNGEQRKN
jgi:hypothetical protein